MRCLVDEYTGMRFIRWFPKKNAMVEPTAAQFYQWMSQGMNIKYVRCDNAGENKSLEEAFNGKD